MNVISIVSKLDKCSWLSILFVSILLLRDIKYCLLYIWFCCSVWMDIKFVNNLSLKLLKSLTSPLSLPSLFQHLSSTKPIKLNELSTHALISSALNSLSSVFLRNFSLKKQSIFSCFQKQYIRI